MMCRITNFFQLLFQVMRFISFFTIISLDMATPVRGITFVAILVLTSCFFYVLVNCFIFHSIFMMVNNYYNPFCPLLYKYIDRKNRTVKNKSKHSIDRFEKLWMDSDLLCN